MTTYSPGAIVLLDYPYTTGSKTKSRPVLVLLDCGDGDVVVAKLTSKPARSRYDVAITDWHIAGLRVPSIVRIDKLITAEKSLVRYTFGSVSARDRKSIGAVLTTLFSAW
jgi:mRNA interferase MazF